MLKLKKKVNFRKKKNTKTKFRFRKIFKKQKGIKKTVLNINLKNLKFYKPFKTINIRLTQNNIFCTLNDFKKKKTIFNLSAGVVKIKTSKKSIKFSCKNTLKIFLDKIKKNLKNKNILLKITSPKKLKKQIFYQIKNRLRKNILFIKTNKKKCFNGCKVKKKKRKKQRGLKIYK